MDETNFKTNMDTIKEMIIDEEKLVTYVSLSKDLCVHVNDSKKLLTKLVEDIKKKQTDIQLNVSYIISGLSEKNKARTLVLPEQDLDTFKKKLKIVFFEHIYSVTKGKAVDDVALLATNKLEDFPLCTGLIKSNSCLKHSVEELGALKSNSQTSIAIVQKPVAVPLKKTKEEPKNHVPKNGVSNSEQNNSETNVKKETSSPKKEQINDTKSKADIKKKVPKTQKGIAGFFSKLNVSSNKKLDKEIPVKKEIKQEEMDVDIDILEDEPLQDKNTKNTDNHTKKFENKTKKTETSVNKAENTAKKLENGTKESQNGTKHLEKETKGSENCIKKEKQESKKANGKTKSVSEIKKNAKVDKKRKRVLQVSDSESDGEKDPFLDDTPMKSDHESEDEIPPTPVPTVKITSGLHPRKKRKIVDKTYTDEDGYILTKKEEVYESCSDNEDVQEQENVQKQPKVEIKHETSPKKAASKNGKKKISPPQKGKQATLMNFFKKV